jgi:hypothetical protein
MKIMTGSAVALPQVEALKIMANIFERDRPFESAHIVQEVEDKGNQVEIGDKGGFDADYILGGDKKSPVVVENNTT